jgi:fumarate reductase subunit C
MTAPWLTSVTPVGPPSSANPRVRFLMYAALVTGIWSGLLSLLVYGIGRAAGVSFEVSSLSQPPRQVTWLAVLIFPVVIAVIVALISALLRGRMHAGAIVLWVFTGLALISLWGPLVQPAGVTWSSRILLALMHVITWFLVVPQIARIVRDSEPGRSVDRSAA